MVHFHKAGDRKIGQVVLSMKVNPKLDIIALKLANGDIILHRLISWQRVWTAPKVKNLKATETEKTEDGKEHVKIYDYEWSPDGKILAIVYAGFIKADKQSYPLSLFANFRPVEEGSWPSCVVLYDIDANKMLSFINSDLHIRSLCWRDQKKIFDNADLPLDCLDIPYLDLFADEDEFYQFLGPQATFKVQSLGMTNLSSSKGSKKSTHRNGYNLKSTIEGYEKVSLYGLTPDSVPFNILLIGSEDNQLDFYAFGLYRLIRIDLNNLTPGNSPQQSITQLWFSNDLALVSAITEPLISDSITELSLLPICVLQRKWRELHAFVRIKSQIDVRLEYLFDSLKEISSIWEDLMAEIDSKLSNYVQRDEEPVDANPFKQRSNKILLQPDEFIEMLVFGEVSLNLEKFLTELTEKTLKKLSNTIEVSFLDIHKTNINKVQRALFHILTLLNVLKGMSLHDLQFGDLCLSTRLVNSFIRETHSMLHKTVQLQSNLNDSMRKTKSFIRWLHKCTLMVINNDPNSSFNGDTGDSAFNTSYVLTNQDLNLIMNFLRENSLTSGFKFENIAAFFRKSKAKQTVITSDLTSSTSDGMTKLRKKKKPQSERTSAQTKSTANSNDKKGSQKLFGKVTVPYMTYLKEQQLNHLLQTSEQIKDGSLAGFDSSDAGTDLLSTILPNLNDKNLSLNESGEGEGTFTDSLRDMDDAKAWEHDLFDESDTFNVAYEEQCSLYEHLFKMYERFEVIFNEEHFCAKKINELVKTQLMATEAKMVMQIGLKPRVIDYYCGSNGKDDFMVAMMDSCRDSFDLIAFQKCKDVEKNTLKRQTVVFTVQEKDTLKKLEIDDIKFYNEEFLTMVIISDIKKDESQKLKKDSLDSTMQEDMSLISDEEMISEEESGSFSKATNPSKSTSLKTGHQFLLQLAYRQLWNQNEHSQTTLCIDVTAEVERLKPKSEDKLEMEVDESEQRLFSTSDLSSPRTQLRADSSTIDENYGNFSSTLDKSSSNLTIMRYLGEGPAMSKLAVSGTRKVACLATCAGTRVAVYELDNDEEEQQEDDMSADNNSNEGDHPKEDDGHFSV